MAEETENRLGERPAPRRRWRRTALLIAAAVLALPLVALIAGLAGLRSAAVRQAVLTRASAYLAREHGLAITARDFDAGWGGRFELTGVRVGAPGAPPLVAAARVAGALDLGTLRSPTLVVRFLEIEEPRVDLAAPIPQMPPSEPAGPPGFEIRRLAIRRGSIAGAPPEGALAAWVSAWRVEGLDARGSFLGGRWDVPLERGRATVERPGFAPLGLRLSGRLGYRDGGPVTFAGVRAAGEGLRLAISGSAGFEPDSPIAVTYDLDLDPRLLAAGSPRGGWVRARGDLRLPESAGRLALSAHAVPAEILRLYLEEDLFADLSLAGTVTDARADLVLGPGDLARAAGQAHGVWRRGGIELVRADFRASPGAQGDVPSLVLDLTAELLPGSPGRRHVEGTVRAASWGGLAEAVAEPVVAQVRTGDVVSTLAEVRSLWPRLVPSLPAGLPARGSLAADLRLTGPLASPEATLAAGWSPAPGARLTVKASGRPATWSGRAEAAVERLSLTILDPLLPGLAGEVSGRAAVSGAPGSYRAEAELTAAGAAFPPYLERLETARLVADGTLRLDPLAWRGTLALAGEGLEAPGTARVARLEVRADGALGSSPLVWDGAISLAGDDLEAPGAAHAGRVFVDAEGILRPSPFSWDGTLLFDGRDVEAPGTASADRVQIDAAGALAGASLDDLSGLAHATLAAPRVALPIAGTVVEGLRLEAGVDGRKLRIASLSGALPGGRAFAAAGGASLSPLLAEADLDLRLTHPVDAVRSAEIAAALRQGVLTLSAPGIETASGPVRLAATVPLGALRQVPQLADASALLDRLAVATAPGPVSVDIEAPSLDTAALLPALGVDRPERARGGVAASLTFDPAAPAAGQGEVRISRLHFESSQGSAEAEGPWIARLGGGRLEILPARLRVVGGDLAGAGLELRGHAELDPGWSLSDPPAALVTHLAADAEGQIETSLLNPFLAGGEGEGALSLSASASGPLDALTGELRASGPSASVFWPTPYATRLEAPELAIALQQGRWRIERGRARLNGGELTLDGGSRPDGGFAVAAGLSDIRLRVDYGLSLLLDGSLSWRVPPAGRSLLAGQLVLDRGVLDRDVNLDREILALLLAPEETPGTEASLLDSIELDVRVETVEGIRIKNNVGDLRAAWDALTVTGTAEDPVVRGRIDLDPGGLIYAYGQTLRIDRGSLLFRGDPQTDPEIDLATTSSLQDPSIASLRGDDRGPLDLLGQSDRPDEAGDVRSALTLGAAGYYGARVVSRLGESLGLGRVEATPLLVFGETDPTARLTVGRDLSPQVSFALSLDLRNVENQTYQVDLHGLRDLPGLSLQGFSQDADNEGASLQQVLELGGERRSREDGPRLRRLRVHAPEGISRRAVQRALRLRRKALLPAGAAFEAEVDAADFLRRRGYPDPHVTARVTPFASRPGWADVDLDVEPGPRVEFAFAGDRPPRSARAEITGLYRTDFYEPNAIEEMRQETVRAFRSLGHLDPRVEIAVERLRPDDPAGTRRVVIRTQAGARTRLAELRFTGVPADVEIRLAARFPGTLARAELAAALPDADAQLLGTLRDQGYLSPKIEGREFEGDGRRLTVHLAPGERRVFGDVEVHGAPAGEELRLAGLVPVRPGDPARLDDAAQGALLLERFLRGRGFPDAHVRSVLHPADQPLALDLRYEVDPGPQLHVTAVDFAGGGPTHGGYLARKAGIAPGDPLSTAALDEARSRLFGTGLFSRVTADVAPGEDGAARVTFSLAERPRFRLGYGVRWESAAGVSAVVDALDTNFLGRAITFGLRGLYEPDDQSGRLYLRTGGLLGSAISLESFLLARRRFEEDELGQYTRSLGEAALQLARPFGDRTTGRLYARYRTERFYEPDPDPDNPFPLDLEIRRPYAGVQVLFEGRDDPADPTVGRFASLDVSGSGSFLGSDFEFARLFGQLQDFRPLPFAGRAFTWVQSLRVGLARPFGGQELLREERFFAGGELSVRGYETESLGPREILGDLVRPLGGEALLVINQELRLPLPWDLTGLIFFDAGQVWERSSDFDANLATAAGLGLRARTPLGLLRLDLGVPLDRRDGDPGYKLYLGFGNAF